MNGAKVTFPVYDQIQKKKDSLPRSEKWPEHKGRIVMTRALLKEMVDLIKQDKEPILQIAMWERRSERTGGKYMFTSLSVDYYYMNQEEGNAQASQDQATKEEKEDFDLF